MKWPHAAGKSRQGIADSLATVTPALLSSAKSRPSATSLRAALYGWSFNARRRAAGPPDEHLIRAERWVSANTRPVVDLADPAVLRPALDALALRMDGKPAAASTVSRKRAIFYNCVEYAVELGHLPGNPISSIKWRTASTSCSGSTPSASRARRAPPAAGSRRHSARVLPRPRTKISP